VEIVVQCGGPYCVVSPEAVRLLREHSYDACPLDGGILSWRRGDKPLRTARKAQTFPADRTSNAPWKY
jgi:rhodanese-related sulfurtransferase